MTINSKLFILSSSFVLALIGCKNNNKKTDINNEGNSKQYLDLVLNKSTTQNRNTNISVIKNFSIDISMTCGVRNGQILNNKSPDNAKFTISTLSNDAKLPYIKDKECEYKFENFKIDNKIYVTFNNNIFLLLNLKNNEIIRNKSYYKNISDKNDNISVSGSKLINEDIVKLTISDTIISIINDQTIDQDGNLVLDTDSIITEDILLNDNKLTLNIQKAPNPLNIKVIKNLYKKSPSSTSQMNLDFLTTYSIIASDNLFTMPLNNCFIFSFNNPINNINWQLIDNLYKDVDTSETLKVACKSINLSNKNNWNDKAGYVNYIISAKTESGFENAYRVVTIGKLK